jgi:hypothetical protein
MGYFSEMALNKQEELGLPAEQVSAGNAFEDEETFDRRPAIQRLPLPWKRRHRPHLMQTMGPRNWRK